MIKSISFMFPDISFDSFDARFQMFPRKFETLRRRTSLTGHQRSQKINKRDKQFVQIEKTQ